ncbi:ShlB/FhaC/HecB family hemolysin secretion/activation protein [Pseudoduganella danionis]|uniref:BamA/TamA family outer membrane protein n=1 Tax=Pseudoduganella danionis TaxID=1890295 RepID=A0ABW9SIZ5_9BURK|nr:ShlB/FhaC/HecB family hemolysin secretion/activation protein [Pseudoduganella danionis]MTW32102.1 BamA/TamA family outer membrane protein [Pseudoduganella danionis]
MKNRTKKNAATDRVARAVLGSVMCLPLLVAAAEPDDSIVRFEIRRFEVQGNTLLGPAEVDGVLQPYTGAVKDFGDVQRALEALEQLYQQRGYRLVTVELPEQELNGGVVRLRVVQTRIGRVQVINNAYFDEANIRRTLPALVTGQTPNLPAVSANLKQVNENPAKNVTMKLQSGEVDEEVDALLDVKDQRPWKVMANLDNTGTEQTGKTHVSMVLQHANLFGLDHVASLQYTTTAEEPGRVKVYGAGYHIPLYALGDALDLYASYSNVDSGTVAAGVVNLAVSGKGATYGARYTHNLAKQGELESQLALGLDYKAYKNSVLLQGQELGNDVTVHPLSVSYQASLPISAGNLSGQLTLSHNLPGGSRGDQAAFEAVRAGARARYTVLRLSASAVQAFSTDWQLRALLNAQYSRDELVPGEQFGAGGASSVRGFQERELANDKGANVNLEAYTPNWCRRDNWNCRLLGFYDSAYVRRSHPLAGEQASMVISSVGVGARFLLSSYVNLQLDCGRILKAGDSGRQHASRLHVRLGLAY